MSWSRRSLARLVGLLPFPRSLAAWAVARDLAALARGVPPEGVPMAEAVRRRDVAAGGAALAAGDPETAVLAARAVLALAPGRAEALLLAADAEEARGDLLAALAAIRRLRQVGDTPSLAERERALAGRVVVAQPGWTPALPRLVAGELNPPGPLLVLGPAVIPSEPGADVSTGTGTAPGAANAWPAAVLEAMAAAGLPCLVATAPPRGAASHGVPDGTRVPALGADPGETPGGKAPEVLVVDLGPGYPRSVPADTALLDLAWAVGCRAAPLRPAAVLALGEGPLVLAVGRSLRSALGCPLVVLRPTSRAAAAATETGSTTRAGRDGPDADGPDADGADRPDGPDLTLDLPTDPREAAAAVPAAAAAVRATLDRDG